MTYYDGPRQILGYRAIKIVEPIPMHLHHHLFPALPLT